MEDNSFIELSRGPLSVRLAMPGTYYKGTRFDWNGVFRSVVRNGVVYAGVWYDKEDPFRHDNVCGPSEEFSPLWLDDTRCVKPGVGILEVPEGREVYDRFKLYNILDGGVFDVKVEKESAVFTQVLEGFYHYTKVVTLESGGSFSIRHSLRWDACTPAFLNCYNHNFLTMGKDLVDPSRTIIFDAPIEGNWREDSVSGYKDGAALRFERPMQNGQKCFIGDLTVPQFAGEPYHFRVCDGAYEVDVRCDVPMDHAVFWSNHRVACVEPYVNLCLSGGKTSEWTIVYNLK